MPETLVRDMAVPAEVVDDIDRVCLLVPPLWNLDSFVAVNPFLGFASVPLEQAARAVGDALDARLLPPMSHYRRLWRQGAFGAASLRRAAASFGVDPLHLESILLGHAAPPMRARETVQTCAELLDRMHGTHWEASSREFVAGWCAVHASRRAAGDGHGPDDRMFGAWLAEALLDRSLEIEGLKGFRAWVSALPQAADRAIASMLDRLQVAAWDRQPYLYRLLGGVHGWASHFRRSVWTRDREDPGQVRDLLAIRLCVDAAVALLAPQAIGTGPRRVAADAVEDERLRAALQDAVEDAHAGRVAEGFAPPVPCTLTRPVMQAVFCIDVRSELLRRHLESCAEGIETIGFAGFFGVAMRWHAQEGEGDRCPVLVRPTLQLREPAFDHARSQGSLLASLLRSPAAAFPAVETLGLGAIAGLLRRSWKAIGGAPRHDETVDLDQAIACGMPPEARLETAAGMLASMGLRGRFARLVMLCGHQGRSENNPHAAGLDCGACGGHGGALNARVAARLLNDASVRRGLADRGFDIPADTWFVAGVHDTCSDQVRLLDTDDLPSSHVADLERADRWLAVAGEATRRERAAALSVDPAAPDLSRQLSERGGDWSQTRPEWALARNASFVAARRVRTAGRDLGGRTFLHEYDAALDADGSVLSLILSAPMVVASWINLQYFASTVDNRVFGSGDKMLHNRVGNLGVVLGNGSDLRSGLPLQSVQGPDGSWIHEPLRLQVFVEAPTAKIDRVLQSQPGVRDLVEHGWVRLFSLSPDGATVARRVPGLGWETFVDETIACSPSSGRIAGPRPADLDLPEQPRACAPAAREGP